MDGDFSFKKWTQDEMNKQSIFLLGEERILDSMLPLYRLVVEITQKHYTDAGFRVESNKENEEVKDD
ncbi:hypothetical protein, partial [Aliarcobacter butzleri]|uniref:hypothetical protein n=1 Tax=Aliarcobacter butzleri TaxID=28197 RepID=UPI001C0A6B30